MPNDTGIIEFGSYTGRKRGDIAVSEDPKKMK